MKHSETELKLLANELRIDVMEMGPKSGNVCHVAPSYSCVEILCALYFEILNVRPSDPKWSDRDRFIISKGHACPIYYAILAQMGYFNKDELWTVKQVGSILQGHPDMNKTPGVDMTSGSLGNGLSIGLGMALGLKLQKKNSRVFVLLGDGEIQEGMVWEAAMTASAKKADNLVAIVDYNHFQSAGSVEEIIPLHPIEDKWKSFGWNVLAVNGHNYADLVSKLEIAYNYSGQPTVIIAHTVKGKGVSFIEFDNSWHAKMPTATECSCALLELKNRSKELMQKI